MRRHLPKIAGFGAVALIGFAAVSFSLSNIKATSDCTTATNRPCFDQQTGQKLIVLNPKGGENAFNACWNNSSNSNRDEGTTIATSICQDEQYSYCTEGKSAVIVRKFSGSCNPPSPIIKLLLVPSCTLSFSPFSVVSGSSTTLSWTAANAASLFITNIGNVSPVSSGSTSVTPSQTTTYTGTATGEGGNATCSATIIVTAPPAPTCTLSANPISITQGSSSTLSWNSTNSTSVSINNGIGSVSTSGSRSVLPSQTITYTATATGDGGNATCSTTITVNAPLSSISLLLPDGEQTWVKGFKGSVFWSSSTVKSVNVNLLKGGSFIANLASNVLAGGFNGFSFQNLFPSAKHLWAPIPSDLAEGSDYSLEIVDSSNSQVRAVKNIPNIIPLYSPVNVTGRIINAFSKLPLADISLWGGTSTKTNANGEYTISATTTGIATGTGKNLFIASPACYRQKPVSLYNFTDGIYVNYRNVDFGTITYMPIWSQDIALKDFELWPAVTININSDVPVKFEVPYPEERSSVGNSLFKTSHSLSYVLPLDYNVRVKLTDQSGSIYYSPYIKLPRDYGCTPKTLNFLGGQFAWQ